ncbi:MAG TPA: hypothetical protein VFU57_01435 [Candidatus Acidoferrales bacterium]|nr:hypothetical protein [Candidatus Acidoferrales bacterium]
MAGMVDSPFQMVIRILALSARGGQKKTPAVAAYHPDDFIIVKFADANRLREEVNSRDAGFLTPGERSTRVRVLEQKVTRISIEKAVPNDE